MSRRVKILVSVGIVVVLLGALLASTALAQGPMPTWRTPFSRPWQSFGWGHMGGGTMGGWGSGGMMGGWGRGGMMGSDMMGGGMTGGCGDDYPGTGTPITIEQAVEAAQQYLADYGNPDLTLTEVMEFTNNFYAEVEEESTGIHAFELLINRYTGAVYPEPGPNMMWNTKYDHHVGGHMGSMMGGMMGGWWGQPSGPMTVTPEQARTYAQQYLDSYLQGTTAVNSTAVDEEADAFYGYYTIHVLGDDEVIGMLSVNGYSGQVWYHTWHGDFIGMQELE